MQHRYVEMMSYLTSSKMPLTQMLLLESGPGGTRTRDLWVTSTRPYH